MSILKHAKGDSTLLALKIHISRESMILIPVKFQLNKEGGRGWTFSGPTPSAEQNNGKRFSDHKVEQ